jgi:Flp pilus assembly pilin Flp
VQLIALAITSLYVRLRSERGQDMLEYALLGGLIAAAIIAVIGLAVMDTTLTNMVNGIGRCVDFDSASVCDPV